MMVLFVILMYASSCCNMWASDDALNQGLFLDCGSDLDESLRQGVGDHDYDVIRHLCVTAQIKPSPSVIEDVFVEMVDAFNPDAPGVLDLFKDILAHNQISDRSLHGLLNRNIMELDGALVAIMFAPCKHLFTSDEVDDLLKETCSELHGFWSNEGFRVECLSVLNLLCSSVSSRQLCAPSAIGYRVVDDLMSHANAFPKGDDLTIVNAFLDGNFLDRV